MGNRQVIVLFNGPQGVGKSTLAECLAKESTRSVLLDADKIKRQVVGGYVGPDNKNKEEFLRLKILAADIIVAQTRIYLENGFSVFIADLFHHLEVENVYNQLANNGIFFKILLMPDIKTAIERDVARKDIKKQGVKNISGMYRHFRIRDFSNWVKLDTSGKTIDESLQLIHLVIRL